MKGAMIPGLGEGGPVGTPSPPPVSNVMAPRAARRAAEGERDGDRGVAVLTPSKKAH
jgi:hypothetical protein